MASKNTGLTASSKTHPEFMCGDIYRNEYGSHMTRYLKAIVAGGARYGLNGQPCGEVTEEDKSVASELLKRRLEQMKQKNSQQ